MSEMFDDENKEAKVRTVGILTSGGDAPGMNAAIRAVARAALAKGYEVRGIRRGYHGLLKEEIIEITHRDVANKMQNGGTILLTARSKGMMTHEGQLKAAAILKKYEIDVLVVIGGDGSFKGARTLSELGTKVICIPGTIDLDIACTEYSIGFDTACNTAMEAIDKVRETSVSHDRCSIIEVMGRGAGYICLWCGIAAGAEVILLPENGQDVDVEAIARDMQGNLIDGKRFFTIINAEGVGHSMELAEKLEELTGIETRATVLGYMQRGGSPTCRDRVYASIMGSKAIDLIAAGSFNRVIAVKNGKFVDYDIDEALNMKREFPIELATMARTIR